MGTERKLKPSTARRTQDKAGINDIVSQVAKETGFTKKDIKEVYRVIMKVWKERMLSGQAVIVPSLGTIMPWLRPLTMRNALYGGVKQFKLIEVLPKWSIKFVPMRGAKIEFEKKEVTKEQEDNIYIN